jgi:hypothetical protein
MLVRLLPLLSTRISASYLPAEHVAKPPGPLGRGRLGPALRAKRLLITRMTKIAARTMSGHKKLFSLGRAQNNPTNQASKPACGPLPKPWHWSLFR